MRHADFSLICVATHIGAISIIRRCICLRFSQVHVHCNIYLDVGSLHSATGSSYLVLAQNLTTVCTKKCMCSTTETDPCTEKTVTTLRTGVRTTPFSFPNANYFANAAVIISQHRSARLVQATAARIVKVATAPW